jgi:hypothetical protein
MLGLGLAVGQLVARWLGAGDGPPPLPPAVWSDGDTWHDNEIWSDA